MFWVAVASSIFQGVSQSFGEAVFLGFLKGFPSHMIGDVSTGTGFAGILATFTLVFARAVGLTNQALLLIEAPTAFAYFFCFKWLEVQTRKYEYVPEVPASEPTDGDGAKIREERPGETAPGHDESPRQGPPGL